MNLTARCARTVSKLSKEEFAAVLTPAGRSATITGDLPFAAGAGEGHNINLLPAGFQMIAPGKSRIMRSEK